QGFIGVAPHAEDRDSLINDAAQKGLERFDEVMREFAARRYQDLEKDLRTTLTRFAVTDSLRRMRIAENSELVEELTGKFAVIEGRRLALSPAPEVVARLQRRLADILFQKGVVGDPARALRLRDDSWRRTWNTLREALGAEPRTLASATFDAVLAERTRLWN